MKGQNQLKCFSLTKPFQQGEPGRAGGGGGSGGG